MARIKGVPAGQATRAASPAPGRLGRIGAWCYGHRRRVLLGWIIGVIAIIAVASAAGSRFRDDFGGVGQSGQVSSILAQRFPAQAGDAAQVVFRSAGPIRSPGVTARVDRAIPRLDMEPRRRARFADAGRQPGLIATRDMTWPGPAKSSGRSGPAPPAQ